ncbi:MAG: hypothetical protein QNL33_02710 [Akkermansiaceae bacterium]
MIAAFLGEDLHGWDGADVWLTRSAMCRSALENSRADAVTASELGTVD